MDDINVTSAQYVENEFNAGTNIGVNATIDGATVFVPIDTGNCHWVAIKAKHDDPDDSFTIADAD